jgi:hypothetical protein
MYDDADDTTYSRGLVPRYVIKIHEKIKNGFSVNETERNIYNNYVNKYGPLEQPIEPIIQDRGLGDAFGKVKNFIFGSSMPNKNFDMVQIFSKFYSNTLDTDEQKCFNAYIKQYGFRANSMPPQGTKFNPS